MLSAILPAYKDPYLTPTINSLLANARGEIEVIPVLDGADPVTPLPDDPRVKPVYQENKGMREAINNGVAHAKGEYLLRADAHCVFGVGYDLLLTEELEDNWIVNPRRYKLNPDKWQVLPSQPIDYEKLVIEKTHKKFHGVEWTNRTNARKDLKIDEDMAMQGSCWVMTHSWWDKTIQNLQSEGYHTHYQDSTEMIFKTWKAGGKLMVNKKTWFAHKHRDFPRSHSYPSKLSRESWDYALDTWREYYQDVIYPRFFND